MSDTFDERVLALAGLLQALTQVRRIADTGQSENQQLQTALGSVFRVDANDTEAVFDGAGNLRVGLNLLRDYLRNGNKDAALGKLVMAVLQMERRFVSDEAVTGQVLAGLHRIESDAQVQGSNHPEVISGLAKLYAETISGLRPRVMVQGNPHYLGQAGVVAEIRALLLAALRAAVLWRQLGGSLWDFVFQRRAMAAAIDARLR